MTAVSYARLLAVVTSLFFMWGFLTCLNEILVPHLKSIFALDYSQAMLIQFAFFSAYFLFSIPWSRFVNRVGCHRTMVVGLLMMACGAFLFLPAASAASYPLFLTALLVLAAGITGLQVAANPYVDLLGKPETASIRLDLTQAFNSLGTAIAPKIEGILILGAAPLASIQLARLAPQALQAYRVQRPASVRVPYEVIGAALVLLAILIGTSKLPQIEAATTRIKESVDDSVWKHPSLLFGAIGMFAYVGAEVSIGSFLVNYFGLPEIASLPARTAVPPSTAHGILRVIALFCSALAPRCMEWDVRVACQHREALGNEHKYSGDREGVRNGCRVNSCRATSAEGRPAGK